MKQKVSPAVSGVIIVLAIALVGYSIWSRASNIETTSDITPVLKQMNVGKPQTEYVSPEMASRGMMLMGGNKSSKSGSAPAEKSGDVKSKSSGAVVSGGAKP